MPEASSVRSRSEAGDPGEGQAESERSRLRAVLLGLLQDVGVALGRAESTERAIRTVERLVCRSGPWQVAHTYRVEDREGGTLLSPADSWYSKSKVRFQAQQLAQFGGNAWAGEGLIGYVIRSGRPLFIPDIRSTSEGLRPRISYLGLRAALIVPTESPQGVRAVLEFYSADPLEYPSEWLSAARSIGTQLGEFIVRKELERTVADLNLEERRALSRELHDTLGQHVTALALMAERLRRTLARDAPHEASELERFVEVIDELKSQVRAFIEDLGPLEPASDDLVSSLEQLAEGAAARHGIVCQFDGDDRISGLEPTVAQQLQYVAREAVHNAVKHAAAKRVQMTLRDEPERIVLGIRDDGTGFQDRPDRLAGRGIKIMQYRAGLIGAHLKLTSRLGQGTVVRCVVPKRPAERERQEHNDS